MISGADIEKKLRAGEEIPLNFSLRNAAPEVAEALQSGHKDVLPQPSQDAWGLGVTVFELLAGSPAYDLQNATHVEVCSPNKCMTVYSF